MGRCVLANHGYIIPSFQTPPLKIQSGNSVTVPVVALQKYLSVSLFKSILLLIQETPAMKPFFSSVREDHRHYSRTPRETPVSHYGR